MPGKLFAETTLVLRILGRQPSFWVPTVLFPAMLYTFFGAGLAGSGPPQRAMPWLPSPFMRWARGRLLPVRGERGAGPCRPLHHLATHFTGFGLLRPGLRGWW